MKYAENLIADGIDILVRRWQQNSTIVIGKVCAEADRWQAALRQMQTPIDFDLAAILRGRPVV